MNLLDQFGVPLDRALATAGDWLNTCRGCGCDDDHACIDPATREPCSWALLDTEAASGICTTCAERAGWHPIALLAVGRPGTIADYVPAGLEHYANDLVQDAA